MLSTIKNKVISLLQLILVLIYILFEELVWEGIARPVYNYVHSLEVLQKVERLLHNLNAYIILVIFVLLLATVQALGLYSGLLFVSGQVVLGLSFYLFKIPIAAFTFWMFRITEDKLMQFAWFKWLYMKMIDAIAWLKSREIYVKTMAHLGKIKKSVKMYIAGLKEKYFVRESPFMAKVKGLYQAVKSSLKK